MNLQDYARLSAVDMARLVRAGEASPVELVHGALAAIEATDPAINAWCDGVRPPSVTSGSEAVLAMSFAGRARKSYCSIASKMTLVKLIDTSSDSTCGSSCVSPLG